VQLLAQGIVGVADIFIHPQYTASGMWIKEVQGLIFFILWGLLILLIYFAIKHLYKVDAEKNAKERAREKWLEPIPPPKRPT